MIKYHTPKTLTLAQIVAIYVSVNPTQMDLSLLRLVFALVFFGVVSYDVIIMLPICGLVGLEQAVIRLLRSWCS